MCTTTDTNALTCNLDGTSTSCDQSGGTTYWINSAGDCTGTPTGATANIPTSTVSAASATTYPVPPCAHIMHASKLVY